MAHVEKRRRNGRVSYRARWRDPSGKERNKTFTRKLDADRFLLSIEDSKARGAYVDPTAGKVPFGPWAERWYKTTAALKPSTRHFYRQLLDNQILPTFERATLAGIDRMMVREWVAALIESGLGASRIRNAHAVLVMVLDSAVDAKRLAVNVAANMRGLPRRPEQEMHFLTAVQVELFAAAIDPRFSILVETGTYTGLRPGELLALKVKRLDLLRGTVRVAEALSEVNGHLTWGTPKNHERRTVRLPRSLCEELGTYLVNRPNGPDDLVFTAPRGGPIREHKLMERYFKPAIQAANQAIAKLPKDQRPPDIPATLRMHDLRHTAASLLIREGASIKALQRQLGHKDAVQTLNRYGHLYPDELDSLAERLEQVRERARMEARTVPMQPHGASVVAQIAKGAGH